MSIIQIVFLLVDLKLFVDVHHLLGFDLMRGDGLLEQAGVQLSPHVGEPDVI